MGRPGKFSEDEILDAAARCVARSRHELTIAAVAAELGGPVGSIYHRFASREDLLARLWLRAIGRFQARVFAVGEALAPDAAAGSPGRARDTLVAIAVEVVRFCREQPLDAVAATLYDQQRLLARCSAELRPAVSGVNEELIALSGRLTRECFGDAARSSAGLVAWATRVGPYGLVRPHLGGPVPRRLDEVVAAQAGAILDLGQRTGR